jgi:hypothetical protein
MLFFYVHRHVQSQMLAASLLCSIRANLFLKTFLRHAYQRIELDRYLTVTQRDYDIMCTPLGHLYDRSVMETYDRCNALLCVISSIVFLFIFRILKHDVKDSGNVKRESKNYSYKEQMAARELEKELAAKQSKPDTMQLSKKQQDMLQQYLDQEQLIRDSVKKVNDSIIVDRLSCTIDDQSISRLMMMHEIYSNFSMKSFDVHKNK